MAVSEDVPRSYYADTGIRFNKDGRRSVFGVVGKRPVSTTNVLIRPSLRSPTHLRGAISLNIKGLTGRKNLAS